MKNDTLKKHLNILYKYGVIKEQFTTIHKEKSLEISLTYYRKNFTQVDIDTVEKIKKVSKEVEWDTKKEIKIVNMVSTALRLFYYYEMLYNTEKKYAYPEYRQIYRDTGINNTYIPVLNRLLTQYNLLEINTGYWYEIEPGKYNKTRNNYVPLCNRATLNKLDKKEEDNKSEG